MLQISSVKVISCNLQPTICLWTWVYQQALLSVEVSLWLLMLPAVRPWRPRMPDPLQLPTNGCNLNYWASEFRRFELLVVCSSFGMLFKSLTFSLLCCPSADQDWHRYIVDRFVNVSADSEKRHQAAGYLVHFTCHSLYCLYLSTTNSGCSMCVVCR